MAEDRPETGALRTLRQARSAIRNRLWSLAWRSLREAERYTSYIEDTAVQQHAYTQVQTLIMLLREGREQYQRQQEQT